MIHYACIQKLVTRNQFLAQQPRPVADPCRDLLFFFLRSQPYVQHTNCPRSQQGSSLFKQAHHLCGWTCHPRRCHRGGNNNCGLSLIVDAGFGRIRAPWPVCKTDQSFNEALHQGGNRPEIHRRSQHDAV